ncbi:MAG: alpha-L-fucosidase [Chitinophagaceae bacterium]
MRILMIAVVCLLYGTVLNGQQLARPVPSPQQLQWHDLEFYFFIHFGPNTFTDKEWGHGDEPEDLFNPTQMDCRQWCRIATLSGAKGIIITAKHHDGFCLWPSKYSTHTVRESKWRNGKGDVLRELSQACKEYGLKFGVYLSPWDRNHPQYGTPEYNDVYINSMKEILTGYGHLFELWWDGANGEGPNGKKIIYDFKRFEQTAHALAPKTMVFSDIGPDIRWVGNEKGFAGKTNWNMLDTAGFGRGATAPATSVLNTGNEFGKNWIPAECDVSIRPGWFYHKEEDDKVKTPEQLFDLYLKSVGRGANLLLNIPPDRRGLINEKDSAALVGFKALRDANMGKKLLPDRLVIGQSKFASAAPKLVDGNSNTYVLVKNIKGDSRLRFEYNKSTTINCILVQEALQFGQHIGAFKIVFYNHENNIAELVGTTIGHKRMVSFPAKEITSFDIIFTKVTATPVISEVAVYRMEDKLVEQ